MNSLQARCSTLFIFCCFSSFFELYILKQDENNHQSCVEIGEDEGEKKPNLIRGMEEMNVGEGKKGKLNVKVLSIDD